MVLNLVWAIESFENLLKAQDLRKLSPMVLALPWWAV